MTSTDAVLEKFFSGECVEKATEAKKPVRTSEMVTKGIVRGRQI